MALKPLRAGDPLVMGPYRLAARLGSGGMGVVYLGVDGRGRQGAVKVLRDEYLEDEGFRRRFTREAAAIAAIDSPRVARLLDAGPDGDQPWIATEYVHGPTLLGAVAADGPTRPETLRTLATGLAEALRAIHGTDVVHRDLKPSNVIMGADGPKVIDFGIAVGLAGAMTASGVVLGSVGYMAPELISGDSRPGPAADVFGWALTVAFAATGRAPFGDGPLQTLVLRTVHGDADIDGVPDDLRPAVTTALRTRPELRPTAEDLVSWLASGDVPAGVEPAPERAPAQLAGPAAETSGLAEASRVAEASDGSERAGQAERAEGAGAAEATRGAGRGGGAGRRPGGAHRAGGRSRGDSAHQRARSLAALDILVGSSSAASADPAVEDPAPERPAARRRRHPVTARRLVPAVGVVALAAAAASMGVVPSPGEVLGMAHSADSGGQAELWRGVADAAAPEPTAPAAPTQPSAPAPAPPAPLPAPPAQAAPPAPVADVRGATTGHPARYLAGNHESGIGDLVDIDLPRVDVLVDLPQVDIDVDPPQVEVGEILAGWRPVLPSVTLPDTPTMPVLLQRRSTTSGGSAPTLVALAEQVSQVWAGLA
ncbi:hypothetical protein CcI49_17930 [Frankia sp. CcI49]|uniref:serine/threonine-protein kinase n=1 Tax=Frankia sp. CcI49 TaxID=1745382 RepID=UPI000978BC9B|nr:serine/threonine-protein kinase [Frankia sp. CcI49]ONH59029.1 hypothetical protein CcI49_17930 [Frankia sp. CcI49]